MQQNEGKAAVFWIKKKKTFHFVAVNKLFAATNIK